MTYWTVSFYSGVELLGELTVPADTKEEAVFDAFEFLDEESLLSFTSDNVTRIDLRQGL